MAEYRLGKRKPKLDKRTLPFKCALKGLPPIPETFDLEPDLPTPMFANDKWGSCVIAGRAHHTLRFEHTEQNKILNISDDEVLNQYWAEGRRSPCDRKPDRGLVMLDSLKHWRKDGWVADSKHYEIYAFAKINQFDLYEVRAATYLLNGIYIGLALPNSARNQDIWSVVSGTDSVPGSWGGHCVFVVPTWENDWLISERLISCVTWGGNKMMTASFFQKYTDEAYAIVDNKNKPDSLINVELLDSYLKELEK